MQSPTQRSLVHARSLGWRADVVEKWIPQAKIRKDLFGVFDILAFDFLGRVVGIQACAAASAAARVAKLRAWEDLGDWTKRNGAEVWAWAKQGPRGKRKVWTLRRIDLNPPGGSGRDAGHDPTFNHALPRLIPSGPDRDYPRRGSP